MDALGALAIEQAQAAAKAATRDMLDRIERESRRDAVLAKLADAAADPFRDWRVLAVDEAELRDCVLRLRRLRIECYRPEYVTFERAGRWGKQRATQRPMFPGYLLVRFGDDAPWQEALGLRGVLAVLMDRAADGVERPAVVPPESVAAVLDVELRKYRNHRTRRCLAPFPFRVGQVVSPVHGEFARRLAVVERLDAEGRIGLLLGTVTGRIVRRTFDAVQVRAI